MQIVEFEACDKCDDFRALSGAGNGDCSHCHGKGTTRKLGRPRIRVKCSRCGGSGRCPVCKGLGVL